MSWIDKLEVKKGNIGEEIVKNELEKYGFIVYKAITKGAHKIDYFVHQEDKKDLIAFDIKTKKRRAWYSDTGCNINAYEHYKEINEKYNIKTYLIFVDEFEGFIYGEQLDNLGEGKISKNQIYWPLEKMKIIRKLTNKEIEDIIQYQDIHSLPPYDYSNTKEYFINLKIKNILNFDL